MVLGTFYLVKRQDLGNHVYKIGRTCRNIHDRLKEYPKGTSLVYFFNTHHPLNLENMAKIVLKNTYKVYYRRDLGVEYFEAALGDTILNSLKTNLSLP